MHIKTRANRQALADLLSLLFSRRLFAAALATVFSRRNAVMLFEFLGKAGGGGETYLVANVGYVRIGVQKKPCRQLHAKVPDVFRKGNAEAFVKASAEIGR